MAFPFARARRSHIARVPLDDTRKRRNVRGVPRIVEGCRFDPASHWRGSKHISGFTTALQQSQSNSEGCIE
jgi:hypothetical protein